MIPVVLVVFALCAHSVLGVPNEYQLSPSSSCAPIPRLTTRLYVATYETVGAQYNSLSYIDTSCITSSTGSFAGYCKNGIFIYQYYHTSTCIGAPYYQNSIDTSAELVTFTENNSNISAAVTCSITVVRESVSDSLLATLTESINVYNGACVTSPQTASPPMQVVFGKPGTFRPLYPLTNTVPGFIYFAGSTVYTVSDTDLSENTYNLTTVECVNNAATSALSFVSSQQTAANMVTYELFYNQQTAPPMTITKVNAWYNWSMVVIYVLLMLAYSGLSFF